jgi:hypothetical protein
MRTSSSTLLLAALILSRTAFAQSDAVETVAPGRLEVSALDCLDERGGLVGGGMLNSGIHE